MRRQKQQSILQTLSLKIDTGEFQELIQQLENEIAAYQQDAERYIWLRDYSPLKEGEDRAEKAAELDALCDEGVKVLKEASDPGE